jgi:hypothetical protein
MGIVFSIAIVLIILLVCAISILLITTKMKPNKSTRQFLFILTGVLTLLCITLVTSVIVVIRTT